MESKLLIDIGNSAIKWRLNGVDNYCNIDQFSVSQLPLADETWLSCVNDKLLHLLPNANIVNNRPYKNLQFNYKLSELGVDRYLAIIAVFENNLKQNSLIIDIGTAITFDLLIDNIHKGGIITAGIDILRKSFDKFNSNIEFSQNIATNTKDAWSLGTKNMVQHTIQQTITDFQQQYSDLQVIITGGRGAFAQYGKYKSNLVLDGVECFVKYNN